MKEINFGFLIILISSGSALAEGGSIRCDGWVKQKGYRGNAPMVPRTYTVTSESPDPVVIATTNDYEINVVAAINNPNFHFEIVNTTTGKRFGVVELYRSLGSGIHLNNTWVSDAPLWVELNCRTLNLN